jgi:hypothetical protein
VEISRSADRPLALLKVQRSLRGRSLKALSASVIIWSKFGG